MNNLAAHDSQRHAFLTASEEDCPEMTEEQGKIMSLVLSHKGVRGNSRISFYYQGMEEERVRALRSLIDTMGLTLRQAMKALKISFSEYDKYKIVV